MIMAETQQVLNFTGNYDFETLKIQVDHTNDWLVGYLGYDLKNQLENLSSKNQALHNFPDICFYQPKHVLTMGKDNVEINTFADPDDVFEQIINTPDPASILATPTLDLKQIISKKEYIKSVDALRDHIIEGDIYEANFCMAFYADEVDINALGLYLQLVEQSPTPFSVYQKIDQQYLLCASPERFLKRVGRKLISQPIKGTIKRGNTPEEDHHQADALRNSEKERAENMMIVDLVRNDLARSCVPGSVKVDEMFGIYPFKHLFHMISTVSGELKEEVHFIDAIKNAFPMGSMTGAPKIKAMELIEQYEKTKRGLFSAAVGFITPDKDFEFNVVIRSIFYDIQQKRISFQAGSAITYDSNPEQEYEECLLKVKAIKDILGAS